MPKKRPKGQTLNFQTKKELPYWPWQFFFKVLHTGIRMSIFKLTCDGTM